MTTGHSVTHVVKHFLVVSALGPDRAGLVAELSGYLTTRGASVEETRMIALGGEFGALILASGTEAELAAVEADVGTLQASTGMSITTKRTTDPQAHTKDRPLPCTVQAEALDHEGIVFAITDALRKLDVSVASLEASAYPAPWSGAPLFRLKARCSLSRAVSVAAVRKSLDDVAAREGIDIDVRTGADG